MKSTIPLIIKLQPLPEELKKICDINPDFAEALKISHPRRFISLGAVIKSYPPESEDEVIGFYVYDYSQNIIKQDFIVNLKKKNTEFILYTGQSLDEVTRNIKHINEFFKKYPTYNKKDHRPKFHELPEKIQALVPRAINLAERLSWYGVNDFVSEEQYVEIEKEINREIALNGIIELNNVKISP
jgi:hypothetical protein